MYLQLWPSTGFWVEKWTIILRSCMVQLNRLSSLLNLKNLKRRGFFRVWPVDALCCRKSVERRDKDVFFYWTQFYFKRIWDKEEKCVVVRWNMKIVSEWGCEYEVKWLIGSRAIFTQNPVEGHNLFGNDFTNFFRVIWPTSSGIWVVVYALKGLLWNV